MADSAIQWTDWVWNPVTGCDRISPGCDHCLAPSTRVLHEDMTWRPIGDARIGDRLVSFDDAPSVGVNRRLRVATVQATWRTVAPTVTLSIAERQIVASAGHRWLSRIRPWWRTTESLRLGAELRVIGPAVDRAFTADYMAGYIVGAGLGDGTYRYRPGQRSDKLGDPQAWWRVAEPDFDLPILERLRTFLACFGVTVEIRPFDAGCGGDYGARSGERQAMSKVETRALASLAVIDGLRGRTSLDFKAGWVAGLYDTDGAFNESVRVSQLKENGALEKWALFCRDLGFNAKVERWDGRSCPTVRLEGDLTDRLAFFAAVRPALVRKMAYSFDRLLETRLARVEGVVRGPATELVDIQTSTGTFIAEGVLTHNCYALTLAARLKAMGNRRYQNDGDPETSGPGFGVTLHPDKLREPLRWRKPRRVFTNSMSDLFHPEVPDAFIAQVYAVMVAASDAHSFQTLTKRPQRMARLFNSEAFQMAVQQEVWALDTHMFAGFTRANHWWGTSIELDRYAFRADHLRATPAAVRWLSAEPLLGPLPSLDLTAIDWVVVGGESGAGHRPVDPDWVRDLRDRCVDAGVAFFFKQWGGRTPKAGGRELDGREWNEYPTLERSLT